jgi:hypothetical protein
MNASHGEPPSVAPSPVTIPRAMPARRSQAPARGRTMAILPGIGPAR